MESQEQALELGDNDVFIVAGITDQSTSGAISLQVARPVRSEEQRVSQQKTFLVGVVHVGLVAGPAPVDIVEIERWRTKILCGIRVFLLLETRIRIERQVVVDELS